MQRRDLYSPTGFDITAYGTGTGTVPYHHDVYEMYRTYTTYGTVTSASGCLCVNLLPLVYCTYVRHILVYCGTVYGTVRTVNVIAENVSFYPKIFVDAFDEVQQNTVHST